MSAVFSSFETQPSNVKFETQSSDERIVLLLRKHFITNLWWIILGLILLLVPIAIMYTSLFLQINAVINLPIRLQAVVVLIWYLVTFAFVFEQFLVWYFNVYIVTNRRVVDVDLFGLLYKQIAEASIDRVQDVTHRMGGIWQVMFNYGDVIIQTAGAEEFFEFEAVPQPQHVQQAILEQTRKTSRRGVRNV